MRKLKREFAVAKIRAAVRRQCREQWRAFFGRAMTRSERAYFGGVPSQLEIETRRLEQRAANALRGLNRVWLEALDIVAKADERTRPMAGVNVFELRYFIDRVCGRHSGFFTRLETFERPFRQTSWRDQLILNFDTRDTFGLRRRLTDHEFAVFSLLTHGIDRLTAADVRGRTPGQIIDRETKTIGLYRRRQAEKGNLIR